MPEEFPCETVKKQFHLYKIDSVPFNKIKKEQNHVCSYFIVFMTALI